MGKGNLVCGDFRISWSLVSDIEPLMVWVETWNGKFQLFELVVKAP